MTSRIVKLFIDLAENSLIFTYLHILKVQTLSFSSRFELLRRFENSDGNFPFLKMKTKVQINYFLQIHYSDIWGMYIIVSHKKSNLKPSPTNWAYSKIKYVSILEVESFLPFRACLFRIYIIQPWKIIMSAKLIILLWNSLNLLSSKFKSILFFTNRNSYSKEPSNWWM